MKTSIDNHPVLCIVLTIEKNKKTCRLTDTITECLSKYVYAPLLDLHSTLL